MDLIKQQLLRVCALSFALLASNLLFAQQIEWTFSSLYAPGRELTYVSGVTDRVQVGNVRMNADRPYRASLWRGSAESWTDLTPSQSYESGASGAGGDQQVGGSVIDGGLRASLWTGTADSWIDLGPGAALGTDGETQVGYGPVGLRAALWRGSAQSFVDLHPADARESIAYAVSGEQQAGYADLRPAGGTVEAILWRGTAESWVSLNPEGALSSIARSMANGQQAGYVQVGSEAHAAIWHGTAESWVDLNPTGAEYSEIFATSGEYQVGSVRVGGDGTGYGALWHGTNQTFDMGSVLPDHYYRRGAVPRAIYQAGNKLYIGGSAYNTQTGIVEGILWTGTIVPEPATFLALSPALLLLRRRKR